MPYEAGQADRRCVTCVFWTGPREIKHLQKRVVFNGVSGVCIKKGSVKFNSTTTYGTSCQHYVSILK